MAERGKEKAGAEQVAAGTGRDITRAMAWMGLTLASFVMVAISGREAGRVLSTIDLMFYRSVISLAILLVGIRLAGIDLSLFRTDRLGLHVLRGTVHFAAQAAWLHALILIPLTELFALEFTAPLWVAVLAPLLLGERLTPIRGAAAALGFCGILFIARPGSASLEFGTLLALASAVGFALSIVGTKLLIRTDAPLSILFYMIAIQTILSLILSTPTLVLPDAATACWLLALGAFGLSAHFGLVRAFVHADAMVVAPMDFLRLPIITVVGVFAYQEALEWAVLAGAGIVVLANLLNLWGERMAAVTQ
ncbi:MAG TPA: DMT family transporter [Hyphomicrobiaceae bacterium]|nr:DMT family transporter [Hyphomicrobiaceae bacterium]